MNQGNSNGELVETAMDLLIVLLEAAKRNVGEALVDISEAEFHWEPLPEAQRSSDLDLPPALKKVWRVYSKEARWFYDYTPETLAAPPFITIAWIMNHIAHTADMYLYCIQSGKPEGLERKWEDLPVYFAPEQGKQTIFQVLDDTGEYLESIPAGRVIVELNRLTPAPWGELRPTYKNIWGGIIGHTLEHATQISALKQRIRFGF